MAIVTARKEDKVQLVYFADKATQLSLTSESSLKEIVEEISKQVLVSAAVPLAGSGVSGLKKNSMVAVSVKHNYFN